MSQIKLAVMNDKDTIVELLNNVTLDLHNKGINQWRYPCNVNEIEMDIKKGYTYMLVMDNLIVGTFSIKKINGLDSPIIDTKGMYLFRIAILPEYQGKNLGFEIVSYACQCSRNSNKSLYLDCWAGNKKLRNFYSNAGFDFIGDFPEEDYMISVFKY
jgi:GNAT superfamily N-acetyltransferase